MILNLKIDLINFINHEKNILNLEINILMPLSIMNKYKFKPAPLQGGGRQAYEFHSFFEK